MTLKERLAHCEAQVQHLREHLHDLTNKLSVLWNERLLRRRREEQERENGVE